MTAARFHSTDNQAALLPQVLAERRRRAAHAACDRAPLGWEHYKPVATLHQPPGTHQARRPPLGQRELDAEGDISPGAPTRAQRGKAGVDSFDTAGKKAAGHLLDGVEHFAFPDSAA